MKGYRDSSVEYIEDRSGLWQCQSYLLQYIVLKPAAVIDDQR